MSLARLRQLARNRWAGFWLKRTLRKYTFETLCAELDARGLKKVASGSSWIYTLPGGGKTVVKNRWFGFDIEVLPPPGWKPEK